MRTYIASYMWLSLFIITALCLYEQGSYKIAKQMRRLEARRLTLESELLRAEKKRDQLRREINSQNDPEWIELVLMKKLGLVPDGHIKIFIHE